MAIDFYKYASHRRNELEDKFTILTYYERNIYKKCKEITIWKNKQPKRKK